MGALIGIFKRLLVVWRRKGSLSPCLACCQIISLARKPVSVDETKNGCTHAKVPVKVTPLFLCAHITSWMCHLLPRQRLISDI